LAIGDPLLGPVGHLSVDRAVRSPQALDQAATSRPQLARATLLGDANDRVLLLAHLVASVVCPVRTRRALASTCLCHFLLGNPHGLLRWLRRWGLGLNLGGPA